MSEWRPTSELRLVTRSPLEVACGYRHERLQQLWVCDGADQWGHVVFAAETEWRDVPIVEVDDE